VRAGTTIDQIVAKQIGQDTPLPSLELATEDFTGYVGACSPGFSCSYMNTISWRTPTTPNPMELNPRVLFERMFGGDGSTAAQRVARLRFVFGERDFLLIGGRDEAELRELRIGQVVERHQVGASFFQR